MVRDLLVRSVPRLRLVLLGCFLATLSLSGVAAAEKPCTTEHHCYAIAESPEEGTANDGDITGIKTDYAVVSEWKTQFETNEQWACFNGYSCHDWVEGGEITGRGSAAVRYFAAWQKPGEAFAFTNYPNGPPQYERFAVDLHSYPPGGVWYVTVGSEPTLPVYGLPSNSSILEAGLEETTSTNITNWGYAELFSWWGTNGVLNASWPGLENYDSNPEQACSHFITSSEMFFAAHGCQDEGAVKAGTPSATPAAFVESNGPVLNANQIAGRAQAIAAQEGDSTPTGVEATETSRGAALSAAAPGAPTPTAQAGTTFASWIDGDSILLVMHGHFHDDGPRPQGAAEPTGSVLSAVIDARTGEVSRIALSNEGPTSASMHALGQIREVG